MSATGGAGDRDGPAADPSARSWVPGADRSGFPLQHLPYGACRDGRRAFVGVRIGDQVLDLRAASAEGLFAQLDDTVLDALGAQDLDPLLAAGPPAWRAVRRRLGQLLVAGAEPADDVASALVPLDDVRLDLPFAVADYVDFYSSLHHASNLGRMFRPDAEPLLPNWRHLPVGYHGRAGTVVVSGTPVTRPQGQRRDGDDVVVGPTARLDFELEVGFVVGAGTALGRPVPTSALADHVFGVVLVNDWSARDIQAWEYVPLGPFLGKSFATSIAAWVTPLDALEPFRVAGPPQEPAVQPYLQRVEAWGLAVDLSVELRPAGTATGATICDVGFDTTYWTPDQQLAHLTVNGASLRPGDLFASGTVSGPEPGQRGSLIEATWNGTEPLRIDGIERTFLADGDEVVLRGEAVRAGHPRIELGEVRGTIVAPP